MGSRVLSLDGRDRGAWMTMVGRGVREDERGACANGCVDEMEEIVCGAMLRNGRTGGMGGSLYFHYHSGLHPRY